VQREGEMTIRTSAIPLLVLMMLAALGFAALANEGPTAAFTAHRLPGGSGVGVRFDASGSTDSDGSIVAYQWVFGDGTSGSGVEVDHTFPRVDRYNVSLLVLDDGNSWHRITLTVDLANLTSLPAAAASDAPAFSAETETYDPDPTIPIGNDVGQRAYDLALPDIHGVITYLSGFRGKVVLMEFWKSTCPGCQASAAYLEALRQQYGEEGLVILLITLDSSTAAVQSYLNENGFTEFVALRDPHGFQSNTVRAYGVTATPTLLLIDRTGVIRYRGYGSDVAEVAVAEWL
jgi:peroxiredoxin